MIKLNIGCGHKRYDGYVNLDIDSNCNPDYIIDIEREKLPFDDNSVSDVNAYHIFEHLGDGFFFFLQELHRVCCDHAEIKIVVPHHRHEYFLNDPTHKRPITVDGLNLFSQEYNNYCISIGDGSSKLGLYYKIDFKILEHKYNFNPMYDRLLTQAKSGDIESQTILSQVISECNNVIMETEVTWVAIKNK